MKTIKALAEEINDLLNIHAENTSESEIYWNKQLGWDKKGSTGYNAEKDWIEALRSLLADFVKEIETEVIGEDEDYIQVIRSNPFLHTINPFNGVVEPKSPQVEIDVQRGVEIVNRTKSQQRSKLQQILKDSEEEK